MKIKKRGFLNPWRTIAIWYIPMCTYIIHKLMGTIVPDKEWYWWFCISLALLGWLTFNFKIVKNDDDWGGLSNEELIGDDEIPDTYKKKCEHPIRRREGYREGVYKCWECGKIIFED